jgi:large conductance mechanosensitive channel
MRSNPNTILNRDNELVPTEKIKTKGVTMLKEFREFALKGNVIDLAVGVIIGAAFNGIVQSLVKDIIMPPIGLIMGRVDFSNLFISLNGQYYQKLSDAQQAAAPTINYGNFLNNVVNFLIIAFVLFLLIRQINRIKRQAPPPDTNTKECPYCASVIPLRAIRCPECTSEIPATSTP